MSDPDLASLPDHHVLWSPETGPVTLGTLRGAVPEEKTAVDDAWENTLLMWERRVTQNIREPAWQSPGASQSARRA